MNCPYKKRCGGCVSIGEPYEKTLAEKEAMVRRLLAPFTEPKGIVGMNDPYHYRNKIHRVCSYERVGRREYHTFGIYAEGTHKVIPVKACLIENAKADAILTSIEELAREFKIRNYNEDTGQGLLRHILIRTARTTGEIMVVLVLSNRELPGKKHFIKKLLARNPEITTVVINVNDRPTNMILGDRESVAYGRGYIEDMLCGKCFRISSRSFYQVNPEQTEKIYRQAILYAGLTGKETVIDAYCGIGTIGIAMADEAGQVIGIESNREAVRDAIANAKRNNVKNIHFVADDAAQYMMKLADAKQKADVIVMDPPRGGSNEEFMDAAARMKPKRIVYVSCNPETLARDLLYFSKRGYRAEEAILFDQFAWTEHVESVVKLTRTGMQP